MPYLQKEGPVGKFTVHFTARKFVHFTTLKFVHFTTHKSVNFTTHKSVVILLWVSFRPSFSLKEI